MWGAATRSPKANSRRSRSGGCWAKPSSPDSGLTPRGRERFGEGSRRMSLPTRRRRTCARRFAACGGSPRFGPSSPANKRRRAQGGSPSASIWAAGDGSPPIPCSMNPSGSAGPPRPSRTGQAICHRNRTSSATVAGTRLHPGAGRDRRPRAVASSGAAAAGPGSKPSARSAREKSGTLTPRPQASIRLPQPPPCECFPDQSIATYESSLDRLVTSAQLAQRDCA